MTKKQKQTPEIPEKKSLGIQACYVKMSRKIKR
jgi:hypothetical protein